MRLGPKSNAWCPHERIRCTQMQEGPVTETEIGVMQL